jgi:hypothetical protein
MKRKDYELVASIIKDLDLPVGTIRLIALSFADKLKNDRAEFKRDLFLDFILKGE